MTNEIYVDGMGGSCRTHRGYEDVCCGESPVTVPGLRSSRGYEVYYLLGRVSTFQANLRTTLELDYNWINQLSNTTIWWLDICYLLHRYQLHVSALMAIFQVDRLTTKL